MDRHSIEKRLTGLVCHDCGSKDIRIGQWNSAHSYVSPVKFDKLIYKLKRNQVYCCVCSGCGLILKQFVDNPGDFKN